MQEVHNGQCGGLEKIFAREVKLHREMETWVKERLSGEFAIDEKLEIVLDSDERPRPKNAKEQAKLREAMLHYQLATYVANDTKLDEAKEKLTHRYELISRRVAENGEQVLINYLGTYCARARSSLFVFLS